MPRQRKGTRNETADGWQHLPVSSVAAVNPPTPVTAACDTTLVPHFAMEHLDEFRGVLREPEWVPYARCRTGKSRFFDGDIIFAKITPCVQNGKCALVSGLRGETGFGSSEFYVIRASRRLLPEYLFFFLRQNRVIKAAVNSFTGTSGRQRVPREFWDTLEIPVPPLPVQERIVEILQKGDDVRRKRASAVEIADAILGATFIDFFGDPGHNPKGLPRAKLGDLCRPTSGGTPSKKRKEYWTDGTVPWVSPEDMKVPEIYDVPDRVTEQALGRRAKAEDGTVLIVVRGMILAHSVPIALVRAPLTFNQDIKGLVPVDGVPGEFLFWSLMCSRDRLLRLVTTASHGTKKIDTDRLLDLDLHRPSSSEMERFAAIHRKFFEDHQRRLRAAEDAEATFASLLSHAFTGSLTADWEALHQEDISRELALHQRLPQLVLLGFLHEHAKLVARGAAAASLWLTALMKYAFLLQVEGTAKAQFYHFVPYHYGPFAKEIYSDLEALRQQGLITVESEGEKQSEYDADDGGLLRIAEAIAPYGTRKPRKVDTPRMDIAIADQKAADRALQDLPADLREDIGAVLDTYGDLAHNALLDAVYEKYPAFAKKSRLRRRTSKFVSADSRRAAQQRHPADGASRRS